MDAEIPFPVQLNQGMAVRKYLDQDSSRKALIITVVRDPLSQFISAFFQNLKNDFPALIQEDGFANETAVRQTLEHILRSYDPAREWYCNWYDSEFRAALDVDIYRTPFDHHRGFVCIETERVKILCLRLESSLVWEQAISRFLGLNDTFELTSTNVSGQKWYGAMYKNVRASLEVAEATIEKFYSSKFARHFYSGEMLARFKQQFQGLQKIAA